MISSFLWFVGEAGHSWDNTVARERSRDGHQQLEHVGIVHQHTVKVSKFHGVATYQFQLPPMVGGHHVRKPSLNNCPCCCCLVLTFAISLMPEKLDEKVLAA